MKTVKKLSALLIALALVCGLMGGSALAAEEEAAEDDLALAYLYCQEDGMPKYWLDFSGVMADDIVLHCYFRSSDPTFYETLYFLDLDTAELTDTVIEIRQVTDEFGFDRSDWFKTLRLIVLGDDIVLEVERDESTLAGGSENCLFSGIYRMEPWALGLTYEYREEDGMLKYWLDLSGDDIVLHGMFRSSDPTFYEDTYTFALEDAEWDGDSIVDIKTVYNSTGLDVSHWFPELTFIDTQNAIVMYVERDEDTMAGGTEDNILSGAYIFEPRTYLLPPSVGPFTAEELALLAQQYYFAETGFFPPETAVTDNGDGTFTIQLFEVLTDHTSTSAWYTVDEMGVGTDDISGSPVYLAG